VPLDTRQQSLKGIKPQWDARPPSPTASSADPTTTTASTTPTTLTKPSLSQWLSKARAANPGVSDDALTSYYNQNYGG